MRYGLLARLLSPLFFAFLWWKGRVEPAWREGWAERRGWVPARQDRPLWIHVASVGEANSAAPLLRAIQDRYPKVPLWLSAFTPTGLDRLKALVPTASVHFLPLDTPEFCRRYLDACQPRALVVLETECWPHLLQQAHLRQIPVLWLSGRIRESSVRGFPQIFGAEFLRRVLSQVAVYGLQTAGDRERFSRLGVPGSRLQVSGSLKLDFQPDAADIECGEALRRSWQREMVWLAASTHAGEEEQVLQAHRALLAENPRALLLLAPRHPRRTAEVVRLVADNGLRCALRSQGEVQADTQVFLIDTLGELMVFFAAGDLAFVGGSLVPIGGHNLLEPAALGRPILTGPHIQSCRDVADALLARSALDVVADVSALAGAVSAFQSDRSAWLRKGAEARRFVQENRGAMERSLALMAPYLE